MLTPLALSYGNTWPCLNLSHSCSDIRALSSGPSVCMERTIHDTLRRLNISKRYILFLEYPEPYKFCYILPQMYIYI